jgi:hypothetical protein
METTSTPRSDWSRYTTDADGTVITQEVQLIFETVGYEPDTFGTLQLKDDESFADLKRELSREEPKHKHGHIPVSTLKSLYTTWHSLKHTEYYSDEEDATSGSSDDVDVFESRREPADERAGGAREARGGPPITAGKRAFYLTLRTQCPRMFD